MGGGRVRKSRVRAWVRSRVEKEDTEGGTPTTDLWLAGARYRRNRGTAGW